MKWIKSFSPAFGSKLAEAIAAPADGPRRVAAFDADGTLWDRDIGEAFMRWLIKGNLLKGVDCSPELYEEYERMVDEDRTKAYGHAVSLMAGLKESDIRDWSAQLSYAWPNYRDAMLELVAGLKAEGIEVWIVSASNQWTIREAAAYAGFEPDRCLGIHTEVEDGVITDRVVHPMTCNQGKVDTIDEVIGVRPLLSFGDSMGDFEMLQNARFPFVVGQISAPNQSMMKTAREFDWPIHMF